MNKTLPLLSFLFFTSTAFAHSTFTGSVKGTGEVCVLEIEQTYYENNTENPIDFRAEIAVNLNDGDHGNHDDHGEELTFIVKPSLNPQILSGVGANQKDLVNVLTSVGSNGIDMPLSFSVKWLHGSHYHTAQCLNLVKNDHE